ncbi:uncharacterized protein [Littorina saxatilis]|uniref:uncharacterized protein n=1 Tax=Littorina saxatilis TaxID=31220 RepID=UPI0038B6A472
MSQRLQLNAVFFFLFLIWIVVTFSSAIRISNCDNTKIVENLEGRDNTRVSCYGSGDNTSTITWTLLDNTGFTKNLATCHGLNNCTTQYSSSLLGVYWSTAAYSYIYLPRIAREFSGTVTCTETRETSEDSASCAFKVTRTRFQSCQDGYAVRESGAANLYCYHSGYTPSIVTWTLTTDSGVVLDLGSCSNTSSCTSPQGSNNMISPSTSYTSLNIRSAFSQRSNAGQLSCSFTHNRTTDVDTCNLEMYHAALLSNCSSEVIRGTWSFLVSCDVTKFWSSRGQYEFRVLEQFSLRKGDALVSANSYTFQGQRSFRGSLSPYTDPADSKLYYRGRLTHSRPINPVPGTYRGFTVYTYPADGHGTFTNQPLNITSPLEPRHNCTEHTDMRDTTVVPCVCSTDYLGSPEGRLVWLLGDTVMETGDYGVNELKFPSEKLTKGHNEMTARCQLDWVKPLTVSLPFVLNVVVAAQSDERMTWVAGAGWTLFAVVVVVAVVVAVVMRRRRKYGIGCCGESLYDRPKRETGEDNGAYSDLTVYPQTRAASNEGDQSGVTERVYQNLAMGQTEEHM